MDERFTKARYLARIARQQLQAAFRRDPNIVGQAFGRRYVDNLATDEPALVIYVMRKIPQLSIPTSFLLPRRVYVGYDFVEVDVVETGPFYPLSFTALERPAPMGISGGHFNLGGSGTLGSIVTDNTDGSMCVLSNNHVFANQNAAALGDPIVQPGQGDGGVSPADDIATLKRFVTLMSPPATNTVDGAIAQVTDRAAVLDQMKNSLMPVASPTHPAVGLLFAGSCNRTLMNPIRDVLAQLNISFPAGGNSIATVEPGAAVEKVGRTTEYTTSDVSEIDVSVTINYNFGPVDLVSQIATHWMSDPGDSGSLICLGGSGGDENHCDCGSIFAAKQLLGVDLDADAVLEREFRQKYLSRTLIGRFAIETFFQNEDRILERVRAERVSEADRNFARGLYGKYIDAARMVLLQTSREDLRVTETHLRDARQALKRAEPYLTKDEAQAASGLLKLARRAVGMNVREILAMLNDEQLYEQVVDILSGVSTLRPPHRAPSRPRPPREDAEQGENGRGRNDTGKESPEND